MTNCDKRSNLTQRFLPRFTTELKNKRESYRPTKRKEKKRWIPFNAQYLDWLITFMFRDMRNYPVTERESRTFENKDVIIGSYGYRVDKAGTCTISLIVDSAVRP